MAGKTFRVAPNASILINRTPGKLAGVPVGAFVSGSLRVDQKTIAVIHAKAP